MYLPAAISTSSARAGAASSGRRSENSVVWSAAADTIMNRPNRELIDSVFPGVPIVDGTGDFDTLLSIDNARKVLGFEPRYSWRDVLKTDG